MEGQTGRPALDEEAVRHRLDLEIAEVRAAIDLVANGVSRRVELNGLAYGDAVRQRLLDEAAQRGVRLETRVGPDDIEQDLVVLATDGR